MLRRRGGCEGGGGGGTAGGEGGGAGGWGAADRIRFMCSRCEACSKTVPCSRPSGTSSWEGPAQLGLMRVNFWAPLKRSSTTSKLARWRMPGTGCGAVGVRWGCGGQRRDGREVRGVGMHGALLTSRAPQKPRRRWKAWLSPGPLLRPRATRRRPAPRSRRPARRWPPPLADCGRRSARAAHARSRKRRRSARASCAGARAARASRRPAPPPPRRPIASRRLRL